MKIALELIDRAFTDHPHGCLAFSGGSDSHGDINEGPAIGNVRLADSHVAEIEAKAAVIAKK